ncbi:MAG: TetR/AcrR family transcriptional regulator [Deltaproteobacteria bacterium]
MAAQKQLNPRKAPRQARAQATVEAILQAATRILVQEGLEAATTNRIAELAGVSVGSFYQYFPSKEAVIFALVERHVERMQRQLEEMTTAVTDAPLEELVPTYVKAMLSAHRVDHKLHRVFSEQLPKLAGREVFQRWFEEGQALVRAALERHRERLRPADLDMAAFLLLHAVDAITHAVTIFKPRYLDRAALADEISTLVLSYLLPPAVTGRARR